MKSCIPMATPELRRYYAHCTYMSETYGSHWIGRMQANDPQIDQADIAELNRLRDEEKKADRKFREEWRRDIKAQLRDVVGKG